MSNNKQPRFSICTLSVFLFIILTQPLFFTGMFSNGLLVSLSRALSFPFFRLDIFTTANIISPYLLKFVLLCAGVLLLLVFFTLYPGFPQIKISPGALLLAGFLILESLCFVHKVNPLVSGKKIIVDLLLILIFLMALFYKWNPNDMRKIFMFETITAILVSLYVITEYAGIEWTTWKSPGKLSASLGNKNFVSQYLVLILPLSISLWRGLKTRVRYFSIISSVLIITAIFLLHSRGSYIAFFAGASYLVLRFLIKKISSLKVVIAGAVLIVIIFSGVIRILPSGKTVFQLRRGTNQVRAYLWKGTMDLAENAPILGNGPGTFPLYYFKYAHPGERILSQHLRVSASHNDSLHFLTERGIAGLSFIYFLIIIMIYMDVSQPAKNPFSLFLCTSAVIVAVNGIFSMPLQKDAAPVFFFMHAGIFLSLYRPAANYVRNRLMSVPGVVSLILLSFYVITLYTAEMYYTTGDGKYKTGDIKGAIRDIEKSLKLVPDREVYRYRAGTVYKDLLKNDPRSKKYYKLSYLNFKRNTETWPFHARNYAHLAELIRDSNMSGAALYEAAGLFRKSVSLDPSWNFFTLNLADIYQKLNLPAESEKYYKIALNYNPGSDAAYEKLGYLYFTEKRYKQAIKMYKESIKFGRGNAETYRNLGVIYVYEGRLSEAEQSFRRSAEQNPDIFKTRDYLAAVLLREGRKKAARKVITDYLSLHPDSKSAREFLAGMR